MQQVVEAAHLPLNPLKAGRGVSFQIVVEVDNIEGLLAHAIPLPGRGSAGQSNESVYQMVRKKRAEVVRRTWGGLVVGPEKAGPIHSWLDGGVQQRFR
jgi:hypothetical protein